MSNAPSSRSRLADFGYWQELALAVLLAALLLLAWRLDAASPEQPPFTGGDHQVTLSSLMWELVLLAVPMTLIVITAGIDLSVGATVALCAVVMGQCYDAGMMLGAAAAAAVITGAAAGALNGVFVAWLRVHPLIVTLA